MGVQAATRRSAAVIGRDAELTALARGLQAARSGRCACLLLVGEGGVGKTRLLTEAASVAASSGLAVFVGRAAVASPTPFGVLAEALRSWHRGHPPVAIGTPLDQGLRLVLPEWAEPAGAADLSDSQLRLLAFEGIVALIRDAAATHGGAVVVMDDLHSTDPESVEAARYLAAAKVDGVCVLAGLRPWEGTHADSLVRGLSADGVADVIEVAPLNSSAVTELVQSLTAGVPPADFIDEILARTDGVPLLVEEVVAAHLRVGSVDVVDGVLEWRGDAVAVPRTVREMFAARLDRLEPAHRDVVHAAAVLGDFQPDLLAEVSCVTEIDLAIDAADRAALLDTSGEAVFRHAIVREAVLDVIGRRARTDLHRRAAAALARLGADDAETLERRARHHDAVGDGEEAARLLIEASHRRRHSHALLAAEQLARAAIRRALDPAVRVAASDAIAEALVAQGRWTEALEIDEAISAAYGDTPQRRHRMATAALEAGRPDDAIPVIARAIADGDESPALLVVDGRVAMVKGDADHVLDCADRVLGDPGADVDQRLAALDLQARAFDFLGRRDDAERAWSGLASRAAATGRTQAQLRAAVSLGKLEIFAGKPPARLHEAVEQARSAGAFVELAWAEENLAIGTVLLGDVAEGRRILDEAVERCRRLGLDQVAYLLSARAMVAAYSGQDAEPWLQEAEQVLPTPDLRLHTATGRGAIALNEGRYDDAVHWLTLSRQIMAVMPGIVPMDAPCRLVWALAAAGREAEARAVLAEVRQLPDLERWHTRPLLLDAVEALLADDPGSFDALVVANRDRLVPSDLALLRVMAAELTNDPMRIDWLREALEIFDGMGIASVAQRIRRLLRDAGAPVPRRRRASEGVPASLAARGVTAREAEVLSLVGDGLSNAEIAGQLVVSVRTVEAHVSSLLSKLQVDRRAQLVGLAANHRRGAAVP